MDDFENIPKNQIIPSQHNDETSQEIIRLYHDPSIGLSSITEFMRKLEKAGHSYTKEQVKKALVGDNSYVQNQMYKKPKKYNSFIAKNPFEILQTDLMFLDESWKEFNDGYHILLTVIDTFTRFGFCVFIGTKHGISVKNGLENIFNAIDEISKHFKTYFYPTMLICDQGKEFYNPQVKDLLEKRNIILHSPVSQYKASICERFNRTIKQKLINYTTTYQSRRYIDVLPKILDNYNNSYHSTIEMSPWEAMTELKTSKTPKYPEEDKPRFKFKVGDFVRLVQDKHRFSKEIHQERYSNETFIISRILDLQDITKYELTDLEGDVLNNFYYNQQLVPFDKHQVENSFNPYVIERKGRKQKIGWLGYDEKKFYRWIPIPN